jgi:hypothetical protein
MEIKFLLLVLGLIGVSYYLGYQQGLRSSIEHLVDQLVAMKFLSKNEDQDGDKR